METDNTNQPVPPQAPLPNPSSHSKIFIIITSVILLTMIGVGIYVLGTRKNQTVIQNQQPTITQSSPTPDDTANWKTYTNEASRFSFKYPGNLLGPCDSDPDDKVTSFYESSLDCNLKPNSSSLLEVFVYDPEKFVIETIELGKPVSSKKMPLSGREFTIDEYIPSYKKMGEKVIIAKTRLSEKTVLELNFSPNQVLKKATVDQIISTFRFTD